MDSSENIRLLSRAHIKALGIDYSGVHLKRLEDQGKFPQRIYLSPARVVWLESEILDFIERCKRARSALLHRPSSELPVRLVRESVLPPATSKDRVTLEPTLWSSALPDLLAESKHTLLSVRQPLSRTDDQVVQGAKTLSEDTQQASE